MGADLTAWRLDDRGQQEERHQGRQNGKSQRHPDRIVDGWTSSARVQVVPVDYHGTPGLVLWYYWRAEVSVTFQLPDVCFLFQVTGLHVNFVHDLIAHLTDFVFDIPALSVAFWSQDGTLTITVVSIASQSAFCLHIRAYLCTIPLLPETSRLSPDGRGPASLLTWEMAAVHGTSDSNAG